VAAAAAAATGAGLPPTDTVMSQQPPHGAATTAAANTAAAAQLPSPLPLPWLQRCRTQGHQIDPCSGPWPPSPPSCNGNTGGRSSGVSGGGGLLGALPRASGWAQPGGSGPKVAVPWMYCLGAEHEQVGVQDT
jgi:hypothetical protein